MIKIEWFYWLCGAFFLVVGVQVWRDTSNPKRVGSGAFWFLLGVSFIYSRWVVAKTAPAWLLGLIVIAISCVAGVGLLGRGTGETSTPAQRVAFADRFGSRIFLPALVIPLVAVFVGSAIKDVRFGSTRLLEPTRETLIGLGLGAVVALFVAVIMLRPKPAVSTPLHEGRRLLEAIGWAALLPQMLATLGLLFTQAGVGEAVRRVINDVLPSGSLLAAVIVYCFGMAVFTMIMGNAFAAFPVMTAAIGWPVLIQHFHGNPAPVFAIGMLAGFCGTLCTPMAANFNIVPAALLELKDQYGPIKAQVPTAVPLWCCNVALMYFLAF